MLTSSGVPCISNGSLVRTASNASHRRRQDHEGPCRCQVWWLRLSRRTLPSFHQPWMARCSPRLAATCGARSTTVRESSLPLSEGPACQLARRAMRHHYASVLLEAGESVVAVAERLGHENAMLVLKTYGHLMPDSEDRTRRAIDDAWSTNDGPQTAQAPSLLGVSPSQRPVFDLWQVLGSNQRRRCRRFYRPLPLATRATCQAS